MAGVDRIAKGRRSRLSCVAGLAAVLLCSTLPLPSLGAESDKAVARAHYEIATRLYDLREYTKALEEYKAAYLAKPDPAFLFNIGQCFRKLGSTASALEFYEQYLKKTPPEDPNRMQAEARIRDIQNGRSSEDDPFAKPEGPALPPSATEATRSPRPQAPPPPRPMSEPASAPAAPVTASNPPPPETQLASRSLFISDTSSNAEVASPPVYARWWFWTGIGVAVVGGAVAAILLARGGSETITAGTTLGTQAAFQ
jgi:hypothetical protein